MAPFGDPGDAGLFNCQQRVALGALCAGLVFAPTAFAAHPLQTEDTGTQGVGNAEFEHGFSWASSAGARSLGFQPQLSYGLLTTLDLIVQPSWLSNHTPGQKTAQGWGDTNVDMKWRFQGDAPWSLATRAGVLLATSQGGLGLPHGEVSAHMLLVATYDAAPFTVHGNVGWTRNPGGPEQRADMPLVSGAVMWAANERLTLTADASANTSPDRSAHHWTSTLLGGAIYTIRPGLDADIGYQHSFLTTPSARTWLLGLTYRFAP
jgi:hypothetical protein